MLRGKRGPRARGKGFDRDKRIGFGGFSPGHKHRSGRQRTCVGKRRLKSEAPANCRETRRGSRALAHRLRGEPGPEAEPHGRCAATWAIKKPLHLDRNSAGVRKGRVPKTQGSLPPGTSKGQQQAAASLGKGQEDKQLQFTRHQRCIFQ